MKITKIGNITYQEGQGEKVWLHLLVINDKPTIFATIAPNIGLATSLAGMYGKVWDTWSFQEVMDALVKADESDDPGISVDIGGVRM